MKPHWIKEAEAAQILGYGSQRWFRSLVKMNKLEIGYTSVRGRNFQYDKRDIDRILLENSTIRKTA